MKICEGDLRSTPQGVWVDLDFVAAYQAFLMSAIAALEKQLF
jgi:hypothetical protein